MEMTPHAVFLDNARVSVPSMAAAAAQSTQHWVTGAATFWRSRTGLDIVPGGRQGPCRGFGPVGKGGKLGGLWFRMRFWR